MPSLFKIENFKGSNLLTRFVIIISIIYTGNAFAITDTVFSPPFIYEANYSSSRALDMHRLGLKAGIGFNSPENLQVFENSAAGIVELSGGKVQFLTDLKLLEIEGIDTPLRISSESDNILTEWAIFRIGGIIAGHRTNGIFELENRWWNLNADFIFNKREFYKSGEKQEIFDFTWKPQLKAKANFGWASIVPGTLGNFENFDGNSAFYKGFRFGYELYAGIFTRGGWQLGGSYSSHSLLSEERLDYSEIEFGLTRLIGIRDDFAFSYDAIFVCANYHKIFIGGLDSGISADKFDFTIKYAGFLPNYSD